MKTSITNKEIWKIAYPIILGNLAQTIITFTDTAFLGHLGVVELGASMMAGLYYYVFTTLAMGFAVGIQIIVARRFGERRFERIGVVFEHGALFILCLGVMMFLVMHFFSDKLLYLVLDSPNIYASAMEYINYRQYGIFFVCFNYLYRSFYVGISNTKVITFSTLLMAAVNIFLDYCLIFGNCGLPEMGIGGAALASFAAEVSACVFFFVYTYVTIPRKEYAMFQLHPIEGWLVRDIFRVALPTMMQRMLSFGVWFVFFVMIEKMGELAIGVSSIVRSVYMLLIIPPFSFASTANTLTSRVIGAGQMLEIRAVLLKVFKNSILTTMPLMMLCVCFPSQVMSIYTDDPSLALSAVPSIYVICIATIIMTFAMVYFEAVSGTGNTTAALLLEIGVLILYVSYIWIMTILDVEVQWVWTAEWLYALLIGMTSFIYMRFGKWHGKKV